MHLRLYHLSRTTGSCPKIPYNCPNHPLCWLVVSVENCRKYLYHIKRTEKRKDRLKNADTAPNIFHAQPHLTLMVI